MVKESQEAFKLKAKRKSTYFSSRDVEHVRPMFESTWCALLAACSAVLDDGPIEPLPAVVSVALRGFANAVHIMKSLSTAEGQAIYGPSYREASAVPAQPAPRTSRTRTPP